MRAIKFRAWWIEKKVMLHEVHEFYDTLGDTRHGNVYEPESSFGEVLDKPDKYIVMQYTGLKDKNDKEIYEGDIVVLHGAYGTFHEIVFENAQFIAKGSNRTLAGDVRNSELEVIGNIYENGELLNEN